MVEGISVLLKAFLSWLLFFFFKAYFSVLGNQGHDEDETERRLKSAMLEKVRIKIVI